MRPAIALLLLAALVHAATAQGGDHASLRIASEAIAHVEVRGARVRAREVLGPSAPDVDLGPTPPLGSWRILERVDIERAYRAANVAVPKMIPSAVRVSLRTRRLGAAEVSAVIRFAVDESTLPRSATVLAVRAVAAEIPADFGRVVLDVPPLPGRSGILTVPTRVRFLANDGTTLQTIVVAVELSL